MRLSKFVVHSHVKHHPINQFTLKRFQTLGSHALLFATTNSPKPPFLSPP